MDIGKQIRTNKKFISRPHLPPGSQDPGYDYRYEFSETRYCPSIHHPCPEQSLFRKVLEEFFKAENEFPAGPSQQQTQQSIHTGAKTINYFRIPATLSISLIQSRLQNRFVTPSFSSLFLSQS